MKLVTCPVCGRLVIVVSAGANRPDQLRIKNHCENGLRYSGKGSDQRSCRGSSMLIPKAAIRTV
jgi:hypothetical protein